MIQVKWHAFAKYGLPCDWGQWQHLCRDVHISSILEDYAANLARSILWNLLALEFQLGRRVVEKHQLHTTLVQKDAQSSHRCMIFLQRLSICQQLFEKVFEDCNVVYGFVNWCCLPWCYESGGKQLPHVDCETRLVPINMWQKFAPWQGVGARPIHEILGPHCDFQISSQTMTGMETSLYTYSAPIAELGFLVNKGSILFVPSQAPLLQLKLQGHHASQNVSNICG